MATVSPSTAYQLTTLGNTLVAVWHGECNLATLGAFSDELESLAKRRTGGIYAFNVITESTGIPDQPTRALLQARFSAMRGSLRALANILEKRGVVATLSRTVLTTVVTLARHPFEHAVFAERREAADWLARYPEAPTADDLCRAARALRPPSL